MLTGTEKIRRGCRAEDVPRHGSPFFVSSMPIPSVSRVNGNDGGIQTKECILSAD